MLCRFKKTIAICVITGVLMSCFCFSGFSASANDYGSLHTFYNQIVHWYGGDNSFGNSYVDNGSTVTVTFLGNTRSSKSFTFYKSLTDLNNMSRETFLNCMGISYTTSKIQYTVSSLQQIINTVAITGILSVVTQGKNLIITTAAGIVVSLAIPVQSAGTYRKEIIQVPDPVNPNDQGEYVLTTYQLVKTSTGSNVWSLYSDVVL